MKVKITIFGIGRDPARDILSRIKPNLNDTTILKKMLYDIENLILKTDSSYLALFSFFLSQLPRAHFRLD